MVLGHEMVSNAATLFFGGGIVPITTLEMSDNLAFVNDISSVHGYTVYGFTDLVLHLVREDPDNTGILEQPATTTDIIVAPKYELILWSEAQMPPIPEAVLTTKALIVWVPQNACLLCEAPRPQSILLDAAPRVPELEASYRKDVPATGLLRLLRLSGVFGIRRVNLALGTAAQVSGHGLNLLVVGAMLWSVLTTSWYNTGIGCGVPLAVLGAAQIGLNFFLPIIPITHNEPPPPPPQAVNPDSESNSGSEDFSALSDEDLEREIAELMRAMTEHDANIDRLQFGIARLDAHDAVLSQVEDGLASAEGVANDMLTLTQARLEDDKEEEGEEEGEVAETEPEPGSGASVSED